MQCFLESKLCYMVILLFQTRTKLAYMCNAGPLGQGVCNAVGLALAEKHLAARYNKPDATIVDHYTYVNVTRLVSTVDD